MIDQDDEIVQDFLIEAGEILEQLGEQLVELEQNPTDTELLNAVFRGFHTIKGGASFLNLAELVDSCHSCEDVFNVLRQRERTVDAALMDVVLKILDFLNEQFARLRANESLTSADPILLEQLKIYASGGTLSTNTTEPSRIGKKDIPAQKPAPTVAKTASSDNIDECAEQAILADTEFEQLLDAVEPDQTSDSITSDEFEELLDALHGSSGVATQDIKAAQTEAPTPAQPVDKPATVVHAQVEANVTQASDIKISDNEFEALLDELHGKGQHRAAPAPSHKAAASLASADASQPIASTLAPPDVEQSTPKHPEKIPPRSTNKDFNIQGETTVRVDTKRLDEIMNMVGELVLVRNRLVTLETTLGGDDEVAKAVANLDVVTANLQTAVMKTRMQPIKKVFGRFPRVVRDLARSLKKEVLLELQGEDTDLDKNLVEALADPLVHLVRNAVDHGIENPATREKAGKPRAGTMILAAEQEGDHILLSIEDDGAGIDSEKLRRNAVEKGLIDAEAAARLDQRECYDLIFLPGFSTKQEITDVSGRGVGMDVVKTRIAQLNGSIEVESKLGRGSRIAIKVPLTLAIMPTLMVTLGEQTFALPLVSVSEIFNLDLTSTNMIDGQLVIMVRDKAMPIFFLRKWLVGDFVAPKKNSGHVVVVNVGTQKVGFVVDHLIGQEEVVIKPLGALLHGTAGMAGATITGDGRIALILDIPGLMKSYVN